MKTPTVHMLCIEPHLEDAVYSAARTLGYDVQSHLSSDALLSSSALSSAGCVITGLQIPGRAGSGVQRRLLDLESPLVLIFVTAEPSVSQTVLAMRSGAATVIQTPFGHQQLTVEIRSAVQLSEQRLEHIRRVKEARSRLDTLTSRERKTLPEVLSGRTNDAIARQLAVSTRTIERRRRSILERLGVDCFTAVVRLLDVAELPIFPFLESLGEEASPYPASRQDRTTGNPTAPWQQFPPLETDPVVTPHAGPSVQLMTAQPEPVGIAAGHDF